MKKILPIMIFILIPCMIFAKDIEIRFWYSSGFNAKQVIEEMVREYNRMQSGVKITPVFQGLYQEMEIKMRAAAVSGQLPDVAQEKFEFMDLYIEEGIIKPIDD